jgi:hypothetical protein
MVRGLLNPTMVRGLQRMRARAQAARDLVLLPQASSASEQWQRVTLIRAVDEYLDALDPRSRTAVEVSGNQHAGRPWRSYTSLNYPDFDLCAPPAELGTFEVVLCEQVIEHVVDPGLAAVSLRSLCAPGGHVVVSTPFLVRVHELPLYGLRDYWRFTPRGLGLLLERAGLEVEAVAAWGNRRCVVGNFDRWPAYRPWHSLRNEPDLPVQVWAFARNPARA